MLGKIILWVSGLVFTSYGLVCFLSPEVPAGYAGLGINNGDAYAEIGAMYGGLQFGVGLYCIICALRPTFYRQGLTLLALVIGCLATARLYSAFDADWMVGGYTWGAMAYEFSTAILAGIALRK